MIAPWVPAVEHVMPERRQIDRMMVHVSPAYQEYVNEPDPTVEYFSLVCRLHWQPATANEAVMWGAYRLVSAARGIRWASALDGAFGNTVFGSDWACSRRARQSALIGLGSARADYAPGVK